jgi:hypothetical protein
MKISLDDYPWFSMINQNRVMELIKSFEYDPTERDWAITCAIIEDVYGKETIPLMDPIEVENNFAGALGMQAATRKRSSDSKPIRPGEIFEQIFRPFGFSPEEREECKKMEEQVDRELKEKLKNLKSK